MPPRTTIFRPSITMRSASTKKPSSTQLQLTNIASLPTNTPLLPTLILINDNARTLISGALGGPPPPSIDAARARDEGADDRSSLVLRRVGATPPRRSRPCQNAGNLGIEKS